MITLLDGIPHAVVVVDTNLDVSRMNHLAEALTGRSNGEASGIHADYILRSSLHPFNSYFEPVFGEKQTVVHEGNILDRNRKIVPIRFTISRIESHKGRQLGAMVVLEDLTLAPYLQESLARPDTFDGIVSLNPRMQDVGEQISVFAATDASVLIEGETGTGKGYVAEKIHQASKRSSYPFIKVNCGALPEQLLESELFGHVRGAFPGADHNKPGMFRLADRGTIFFTEVGDLPVTLQIKLLTVLDDGEFFAIGSTRKVAMTARIIAATSMDLKGMVREGLFREDLYYRLNVLRLDIPPLRERSEDVPLLVDYFLSSFSPGELTPRIDRSTMDILKEFTYPGNVRELRNILEHAITLSHGDTIKTEHLPEYLLHGSEAERYASIWRSSGDAHGRNAAEGSRNKDMKWDDVEKEMIIEALRKSRGKRSEAAKMLGWARSTLYRKLKYHEL
ncbi:MAG: sigma 54-interacting transcriptional regulator [Thermoleophilia bacterium]|nr:sigma 54-interacting transcriptional regulator [Thermoleophilia bacterium]